MERTEGRGGEGRLADRYGDWRSRMETYLPLGWIPSRLVEVKEWPLTANGKLDRARLRELGRETEDERATVAPRTERETALLAIWREVLGRERIGIHDNFFELGGHSLLAFRLVSKIRDMWEIDIPLAVMFSSQTVAAMAEVIDKHLEHPALWPNLIPLQTRGERPPLFCIHSGFGWLNIYFNLVKALGEKHPIYGLEQSGYSCAARSDHQSLHLSGEPSGNPSGKLSGDQRREPISDLSDEPSSDLSCQDDVLDESIVAMAQRYVQMIRHIQPSGPYHLIGHCFGGLVAFEMAQQLVAQGEEVAFLALLDTFNPVEALEQYQNSAFRDEAIEAILLGGSSRKALRKRHAMKRQQLIAILHRDLLAAVESYGLDLPELTSDKQHHLAARIYDLIQHNTRLALEYPLAPYSGKICYFEAEQRNTDFPAVSGWARFTEKPFETITIPANHFTMMTPPAVERLARQILAQVDSIGEDVI